MNTRLVLSAAGVSVALETTGGDLPEVLHWGDELGAVTQTQLAELSLATRATVAPSAPDVPVRYAVLPEARRGVTVRPGLIGSRDGRDWTPDWRVDAVTVDGAPAPAFASLGAAGVDFHAVAPGLELTITVELTPQGLVAARAVVTNAGDYDNATCAMIVREHGFEGPL